MHKRMNEIWDELDSLLAMHAPRLHSSLNIPATEEHIATVEQHIGVKLPDDLRTAYLRHDGQKSTEFFFGEGRWWLNLDEIKYHWHEWTEIIERESSDDPPYDDISFVKPTDIVIRRTWHRRWIPISCPSAQTLLCADMSPGPAGNIGQIIFWELTMGPIKTPYADCFCSYLEALVNGLRQHKIKYLPVDNGPGGSWINPEDGKSIHMDWCNLYNSWK